MLEMPLYTGFYTKNGTEILFLLFFSLKDKKKTKKTCLFYKKTISLQRKLS